MALALPEQLNPGPLASRITFFAPVSLLFFFFVVAVLATVTEEFHPMHYFMIGCAFFAFHLLFAYLVDHVPVTASFALSALVSLLLVVSYARLFVGWRPTSLRGGHQPGTLPGALQPQLLLGRASGPRHQRHQHAVRDDAGDRASRLGESRGAPSAAPPPKALPMTSATTSVRHGQ
ncbi:MAG: inner membrane CreD family protein [Sandaracinaceae bacterium]|nr:inner membrane CreD family protein [Sandaracinaceae bacterium]